MLKKFFNKKKPVEPIDQDLPLFIRMGSSIKFPEADFALLSEDSYIQYPGEGLVKQIGKFEIHGFHVYRLYLEHRDGESMLQIFTKGTGDKGKVEEVVLFQSLDEIYPGDEEQWDEWLDDEQGHIGAEQFYTPDDVEFARAWHETGGKVPPERFSETVYLDRMGEQSRHVTYQAMLYQRDLEDDMHEQMLVAAEEDADKALIRISVGLPLSPASLEII